MSLISRFSTKSKRTLARTLAVFALIGAFLVPVAVSNSYADASGEPKFNFLSGDSEMLTAANVTKAQADWTDPVTGSYAAEAGDVVAFRFYFHNGYLNTTAHNVILKAIVPDTIASQQRIYSSLDSDQTPVITDTVIDGNIKGYGNGFAQVDLKTPGRLEYIPGSTKMWRTNPNEWGTALPDGISSAAGLNIGAIGGCWNFAGYVTFKAKVLSPAQIVINKYVSCDGNNWQKTLSGAKEGDTVSWKVAVKNVGQTAANNVLVSDELPAKLTYIAGSTKYFAPGNNQGVSIADGITTSGVTISSLNPGSANEVYYIFRTKIGTNLTYSHDGVIELINTAIATFMGASVKDHACVLVCAANGMTINKQVWNGSAWVEQNYIKLGDSIRYRIILSNTGQASISNIKISDIIPIYSEYVAGSTTINGNAAADGIAGSGLVFSSLARGASLTIEFTVKTYGCPPVGDYNLVNTAYGLATNISQISDTASTIMTLKPVSGPNILGL